jgi:hypothetical protein
VTPVADLSPHGRGSGEEAQVSSGAIGAALFRPALHKALQEAVHWKAATTASSIFDLPPLPMLSRSRNVGEERNSDEAFDSLQQLSSALSSYRTEKASARIVDLTIAKKAQQESVSPAERARCTKNCGIGALGNFSIEIPWPHGSIMDRMLYCVVKTNGRAIGGFLERPYCRKLSVIGEPGERPIWSYGSELKSIWIEWYDNI